MYKNCQLPNIPVYLFSILLPHWPEVVPQLWPCPPPSVAPQLPWPCLPPLWSEVAPSFPENWPRGVWSVVLWTPMGVSLKFLVIFIFQKFLNKEEKMSERPAPFSGLAPPASCPPASCTRTPWPASPSCPSSTAQSFPATPCVGPRSVPFAVNKKYLSTQCIFRVQGNYSAKIKAKIFVILQIILLDQIFL